MSAAKKSPKPSDDLTLEEAMARLEAIVESMEDGEVPLDTLVARYEEGMRLLQSCEEKLGAAELRIRELGGEEAPADEDEPA